MLGLGWTEMLVIGIVALIVIGPKDLPVVMGRIGKFAGQIKRMGSEFQREINKTTGLDEVRNLRNSITGPLKKSADEIRREFNAMTPTGVQPSGVIKPADPKAESVVDEIRAAAGIKPENADPAKLAAAAAAKPAGAPASLAEPAKAAASPTRQVISMDLELATAPKPVKATRRPAVKANEVPAPTEAPKPRARRAKPASAEGVPEAKPAPRKRTPKTAAAKASVPNPAEPQKGNE